MGESITYVAFVSGFWVSDEGGVVLSYGSGDASSRVLQMQMVDVDALFEKAARAGTTWTLGGPGVDTLNPETNPVRR
jgi:hypothetical protein